MYRRQNQASGKLDRVPNRQRVANFQVPGIERANGFSGRQVLVPRVERGEPCACFHELFFDGRLPLLAAATANGACGQECFRPSFFCFHRLLNDLVDLAHFKS
jgi:hypothetical protein